MHSSPHVHQCLSCLFFSPSKGFNTMGAPSLLFFSRMLLHWSLESHVTKPQSEHKTNRVESGAHLEHSATLSNSQPFLGHHGESDSAIYILTWFLIVSLPQWNVIRFFFVFLFLSFRATPMAYGDSQARGPIGAIAASLHYGHSNARSKPRLRPTPQLMATPDL